jgi:hypothetical protein
VLLVAPVVLLVWLELLAMLPVEPVCALAEVFGVLDCELMSLEAVFGLEDVELEVELFGLDEVEPLGEEVVLLGEVLVGELLVLELDEPAFPEMLPAVFCPELDGVAAEPRLVAAVLATVKSLSLTFFTPGTDLASFFASFLSSLLATEPLSVAVPSLTEI